MTDTLQFYRQDLAIKGFSSKTQATYFACVRKFLTAAGKPPAALAVIRHAGSVKHRAILTLVYGSGRRVGEIPKLTPGDIVRDKPRVKIRQGKGAKDRYAILSRLCLGYYWRRYRPEGPLFEGRVKGRTISE